MNNMTQQTPWLLWPFKALMDLIEGIIRLTGRLVAAVIGLAFMIVGVVLTALVITAPLGIPVIVFGFLLIVRGIF
ncbi:MAG: hypothetical protein MUO42_05290 [Anaerolineaceae bacterium]|jgi:sorbitol-specific phosphotransferase system component IIBC|nr:hypothetical protein [Anaerolineaceae bacterium]